MIMKSRFVTVFFALILLFSCNINNSADIDAQEVDRIMNSCSEMRGSDDAALNNISRLNSAINKDHSEKLIFARSMCYRKIGNFKNAIDDLSYLIEIKYHNLYILYALRAKNYVDIGDVYQAIDDYTSSIKLNNNNYLLFTSRADVYLTIGKYKLALSDYNSALDIIKASRPCGKSGCQGYEHFEVSNYRKVLMLLHKLNMIDEYELTLKEAIQRNPDAIDLLNDKSDVN